MTLLATVMHAVSSGLLALALAAILRKERMRIAFILSFYAIFTVSKIGGLIFAVIVAVFLLLFFMWLRFVSRADAGTKRVLFIATIVLSMLFLALQAVHLPIRFALNQPTMKIEFNVAGIFLSVAMLGAAIELLVIRKRNNKKIQS